MVERKLEIEYTEWPIHYPNTIPPGRALRCVMSHKKTDMDGSRDAVFWHSYDWESITWNSIESDIRRLHRDLELARQNRRLRIETEAAEQDH